MTTWLVHRITGLFLIVLLGTKFITALFLLGETKPGWALALHRQPVIDVLLMFVFSLHMFYGLKIMTYELGFRREKLLNATATVLALAMGVVGTVLYFSMG